VHALAEFPCRARWALAKTKTLRREGAARGAAQGS
jgi:hypothetical protein